MTITAYGTGAYRSVKPQDFVSTRTQLDELQHQLSTQKKSDTYGGLGIERRTSLDLNAKVAKIESWQSGIELANVNLTLVSNAVQGYSDAIDDFAKLTSDIKTSGSGSIYTPSASGRSVSQVLSESQLTQTIDLLNTNVNGRYLFSGRTATEQPVVDAQTIFNGDGVKAGLKTLIADRKTADLGTAGLGRLNTVVAGTATTISQQGGNAYYGFQLGTATTTSSAVTIAQTTSPTGVTIDVVAQPLAGDSLSIPLTLPDGTTETIVLKARAANTTAAEGTFELGATATDTATNVSNAILGALTKQAKTTLAAASAVVAGADFFAGSNSSPPKRVTVTPPATLATTVEAPAGRASDSLIWYTGDDDSSVSARDTSAVQIGDNQRVGTGARANEKAFQVGLAQFAVFASETFDANDVDSQGRYEALAKRVNTKVKPDTSEARPSSLITEFGTTQKSLANAKDRNDLTKNYLTTQLTKIEGVTTEEVASQILSLQTQLQATYQVTSLLSKLSLTNYL